MRESKRSYSRRQIMKNIRTCRDYLNDAYSFLREDTTVGDNSSLAMMDEVVEIAKTQQDNIKRLLEEAEK